MLNKNGERELAYVVKIDDVRPTGIEGVNNVLAIVGGWQVFVKPTDFKKGDLAVYFEIDSLCPHTPEFEFLYVSGKYRIKTQKYIKGQVLSQGLLMKLSDLGLEGQVNEGDFLTEKLGVVYYEPGDNERKGKVGKSEWVKKFEKWQKKHPFMSSKKFFVWIYKLIHPKNKKKKNEWPSWVVKTDEERIQNQTWRFQTDLDKAWIATEKIDGTSTTFTMRKKKFFVCSRNVVFNDNKKKSFYDDTCGNVYLEMAHKYDMKTMLSNILSKHKNWDFITIQGETFGGSIQKRNYGDEHRLAVFNVIYCEKGKQPIRMNPIEMTAFVKEYGINGLMSVPVVDTCFKLPESCDELLQIAEGTSQIDGKEREGLVFRSLDGVDSFKAVSNSFLMKYHG